MPSRDRPGGDALPLGIDAPTPSEFHMLALRASALGRPAIPDLMLLARDGVQALGRLCAICALGRMAPLVPTAAVALDRVASLPRGGSRDDVLEAAVPDSLWPFEGTWDPSLRLRALHAKRSQGGRDTAIANPPKPPSHPKVYSSAFHNPPVQVVTPRRRRRSRIKPNKLPTPDPSIYYDGWWREQE